MLNCLSRFLSGEPLTCCQTYGVIVSVSGNLVADACKVSFQKGFDGFVAFTAKTNLIKHYEENLGAFHFKNQRMIIETESAKKLVKKIF
ncbi:hypothetical protein [Flavobacterium sp. SM2513]|uniref:hypothetical protein n=1 Tax=Flavobacterium sp. SM2513 TaxID=3424766 RepID=UPI003D7F5300